MEAEIRSRDQSFLLPDSSCDVKTLFPYVSPCSPCDFRVSIDLDLRSCFTSRTYSSFYKQSPPPNLLLFGLYHTCLLRPRRGTHSDDSRLVSLCVVELNVYRSLERKCCYGFYNNLSSNCSPLTQQYNFNESPLLRLPAELRTKIWDLCLSNAHIRMFGHVPDHKS